MDTTKWVKTFEDFDKESEREVMETSEETIKKIWDVIDSGEFFCIISSYNDGDPESLNGDYENLKNDVLKLKYAYVEQSFCYNFCDGKGETTVRKKSLFVPSMTYEELLSLGKKYNQETISFGGNGGISVVRVSDQKVLFEMDVRSMKLAWNFFLTGQQNIPW